MATRPRIGTRVRPEERGTIAPGTQAATAAVAGASPPPAAESGATATIDPLVNLCQVLLSANEFLYVE